MPPASQSRAELDAQAERILVDLAELRRRHDSEHASLEEEASVGRGLGPLGRSTMRTDVFAELQRDANAAHLEANRGARLGALEHELEQALSEFRNRGSGSVLERLEPRHSEDVFAQALQQHEAQQTPVVTLLGKLREAQLHLGALYREAVHSRYFERFSLDSLHEDERRQLAPLALLAVDSSTSRALPSIVHLASSHLPVIVVRVCRPKSSGDAALSPELPLPCAALAFSPQWTWLQTTWHEQASALPPSLAEMLSNLGRTTGPAFVDILACDSARQAELAEACGVWPSVAYSPGEGARGGATTPLVRWSPAATGADQSPATFAWELLGASERADRFVELEGPAAQSGGKPARCLLGASQRGAPVPLPRIRGRRQVASRSGRRAPVLRPAELHQWNLGAAGKPCVRAGAREADADDRRSACAAAEWLR